MILLDTHVWLWWVSEPSFLSRAAAGAIQSAPRIGISAMSCLEVAMAAAKGRILLDRSPLEWIEQALDLPKTELVPLTPAIAVQASHLGQFHGDPADRVIVASAILESARLVTKDKAIRTYPAIATIW